MEFLPVPQKITFTCSGCFHLCWNSRLVLENTEPSAFLYGKMLQSAVLEFTGLKLPVIRGEAREGDVVMKIDCNLPQDHYTLSCAAHKLEVAAGGDESLLHGIMTLRQYIQSHGAMLPSVEIEDYPKFHQRGYYQDLARGRIPTLEQLKKTADLLCQYKINEWQLYIEHTYMFRDFSETWRDDTPLTAEEIMELDRYCAQRHIELVPSLSTFGHLYMLLSTKSFCDLCEIPDSEKIGYSFRNVMAHHTINVSNPDSMPFIKGMITEYMQLFSSRKFNICCDETFDLARGRSKELGEKVGAHTLYVNYVAELCSWLIAQGITPQFWGDILLHHPEDAAAIPQGTVCLNWDYAGDIKEDKVRIMAETGVKQYVCPGTWSWGTFIPRMEESWNNIRLMSLYGEKYGAIGLLNTDWGDYGSECPPDLSVPGIIYGAAFSWNNAPCTFEDMNRAISFLAYGDKSGKILDAMVTLSMNDRFPWNSFCEFSIAPDDEHRREILQRADLHDIAQANERIDQGLMELDQAALTMTKRREIIWQLHVCAEAVKIVNKAGLYALEKMNGSSLTVDPCALAGEMENWLAAYSAQWREVSKESMLRHIQSVFITWADALRGREITMHPTALEKYERM